MSTILQQRAKASRGKILADKWIPISLHFMPSQKTTVKFNNGKELLASCLRCIDAPCVNFAAHEIVPELFPSFPADRNPFTCVTGAISRPEGGGAPIIDGDRCLLCGVCSARCPVGAISLVPGLGAIVNDSINPAFIEADGSLIERNLADLQLFSSLPSEGSQLNETDNLIDEVFGRLQRAWTLIGDRFPNLLARNLLISAGLGASVGRKGNNHMRMDLILSPPYSGRGVAEVEFGQEAVLDAPRDLLDALAVLVSRYKWKLNETLALIVSDVLPNRRSEYWHIIQDISNVLGVQIGTVTIFSLMLFNWNRRIIELGEGQPFYTDRDTISYRAEVLEIIMGRALHLSNLPRPQVDIAK